MTTMLSPNTQAILLLTAPLLGAKGEVPAKLLSQSEYGRLAQHLWKLGRQPADLLALQAAEVLEACRPVVERARLESLLGRGFLLSQAVERWHSRAIWVVSRADATYPPRLKTRLKEAAPAVLYGCGDPRLLQTGGLAVVGSREADETLLEFTRAVGRLAAQAGRTTVSGGARGVDQAAMTGASEEGGNVVGVMADSLERAALKREHRDALLSGRLALVSPYDPQAGFNVGHAMRRNKVVYALADAALIVQSDRNKGGTWEGAIEQLEKLRFVPVFVRSTGDASVGLDALRARGALPWPNPVDAAGLDAALQTPAPQAPSLLDSVPPAPPTKSPTTAAEPSSEATAAAPSSETTAAAPSSEATATEPSSETTAAEPSSEAIAAEPSSEATAAAPSPAENLFAKVRELLVQGLQSPKSEAETAGELQVTAAQAKSWLKRLVDEGVITCVEKKKKKSYVVADRGLFDSSGGAKPGK